MNIVIAYPSFIDIFEQAFEQKIITFKSKEFIKKADLVIFSGGEDICPVIYGKKPEKYTHFNPLRDVVEMSALKFALEYNKKILGVCRGHQLINAYLDGMLVQDIYFELNEDHGGGHELVFKFQNSIIESFFSKGVNSLHHQGVIVPGKNLKVSSIFGGVIESCESENIITTQFHPEFMRNTENFFSYIKDWARR